MCTTNVHRIILRWHARYQAVKFMQWPTNSPDSPKYVCQLYRIFAQIVNLPLGGHTYIKSTPPTSKTTQFYTEIFCLTSLFLYMKRPLMERCATVQYTICANILCNWWTSLDESGQCHIVDHVYYKVSPKKYWVVQKKSTQLVFRTI